jgi:hypothetical protein
VRVDGAVAHDEDQMTDSSAEQVLAKHVEVLGRELGPVYNDLHNEVVWLHFEWSQYRKLFLGDNAGETADDRLMVLNESAGAFFFVVQRAIADNTILSIARLTGQPKAGQANLTIRRLPKLISNRRVRKTVSELIAAGEKSWELATMWRDEHLAYRDMSLATPKRAAPLPQVAVVAVDNSLRAMRRVLNEIEVAFFGSEIHYTPHEPSDADAVVSVLRLGLKSPR